MPRELDSVAATNWLPRWRSQTFSVSLPTTYYILRDINEHERHHPLPPANTADRKEVDNCCAKTTRHLAAAWLPSCQPTDENVGAAGVRPHDPTEYLRPWRQLFALFDAGFIQLESLERNFSKSAVKDGVAFVAGHQTTLSKSAQMRERLSMRAT